MTVQEFLRKTETIVVLGGLILTLIYGKFWAAFTLVAYILLNVPAIWDYISNKINK